MGLALLQGETDSQVSLPPIVRDWERRLIEDSSVYGELNRLAHLAAGPFHVLNPEQLRVNLRRFSQVCVDEGIRAHVCFARKANKSTCWLPIVAEEGHGVDVASSAEFFGALEAGIVPDKIVVTGAEKSDALLKASVQHGALIAVDSISEFERVQSFGTTLRTSPQPRVLLRLLPGTQVDSRFGTSPLEWKEALGARDKTNPIECVGVSFHLNGYSAQERINQTHSALDFVELLRGQGWNAHIVDIGGGFSVQYCAREDWEKFSSTVLASECANNFFHAGHMPSATYPYGGQLQDGADMLRDVLCTQEHHSQKGTISQRLHALDVDLLMEPGRALLDGCGLSCFPVQGVKLREDYALLTVSGLSMSVSEQWKNSEFLPDPTLWSVSNSDADTGADTDSGSQPEWPPEPHNGPVFAAVGGSSCMEYDMLTWRKVLFPRLPQRGDLLIYHNTAGYQMDKNESEFHQLRLPMRFVVNPEQGLLPRIDRSAREELR